MKRFCVSLICVLVVFVDGVFSVTIQPPALQRKAIGESCKLQWTVTGTFMNYSIGHLTNGNSTPLGYNSNHSADHSTGIITLLIWNIQLKDAGTYQLTLYTGSTPDPNAVGILFVYATPSSSVTIVSGTNPAKEGDTIVLNCTVRSYSAPAAYRPTKLYYLWALYSVIGSVRFQNTSNGSAIAINGDVYSRYLIKNNGSTFVISSAEASYQRICCEVQEEGSPLKSFCHSFNLQIFYRPYAYQFTPASKKLAVHWNNNWPISIFLQFYSTANPPLTSYTNWSFTNASGIIQELPAVNTASIFSLTRSLNSSELYGNYSVEFQWLKDRNFPSCSNRTT